MQNRKLKILKILPLAIIDKLPLGRLLWKQELTLTFSLCMYNIHIDKIRPSWTLDIVTWFYFNLIIQDIDPKIEKSNGYSRIRTREADCQQNNLSMLE